MKLTKDWRKVDWDAYEDKQVIRMLKSYYALPESERLKTAVSDVAHWNRMYRELLMDIVQETLESEEHDHGCSECGNPI